MAQSDTVFSAIEAGDATRLRGLLDGAPAQASARTAEGLPAVLFALYRRRGDLVALLVEAGADLDGFAAAALGDAARLNALLARDPALAQAWSADGFTALHLAAFFGRAEAARTLLDAGADVNAVARNAMQVQPLHSAVAGAHRAVSALLLARRADANARQQGGWTPLHAAAQHGDAELVNLLLAAGAVPTVANDAGQTAAAIAAESGHTDLAARLGDG